VWSGDELLGLNPQISIGVRESDMTLTERGRSGRDPVNLAQLLLTAANVAELLGIPRSSIYDYARRKHDPLPSVEIGRHRRFIRRDVEAWLEQHRLD
jgi:excisionase family DNA binding protein